MIVGTFSRGIHRNESLDEFLGADEIRLNPGSGELRQGDVVVGWGRKPNTVRARAYARRHGLRYQALEDGFIRSVGLGREGVASLSLVADPVGIYFDATQPSMLEEILNNGEGLSDPGLLSCAREAVAFMLKHRISKYNGAPLYRADPMSSAGKNILVVDQVRGDASLAYGCTGSFDLGTIVRCAMEENPGARIHVKLHPETIARLRKGAFESFDATEEIVLIKDEVNPISVLEAMDKVYVATSLMGFEALLLGKEVVCFGMPFYAGWGVTDDRVSCPRRRARRSVMEIFAAAYILYSRYIDPHTGRRCDIMTALNILQRQIAHENLRSRNIFCFGIRHWKRYNVLPFLRSRQNKVVFARTVEGAIAEGIKAGDDVVVWGAREPGGLEKLLEITGRPLLRMEDGFLRSVGLGSDFSRPSSLVLDPDGIYFDPSRLSRLEKILCETDFDEALLAKAARVREKLLSSRLSKYNHQQGETLDLSAASGRKICFVPGQVADDASLAKGCVDVRDNASLLRLVRKNNPDAFIVYKPHPDVTSGNRKGKVNAEVLESCCDLVVEKGSIADILEQVDEVHTMTSLVGFEAVIRGIRVHVYGRPFYAGWGLTTDKYPVERRGRQLSIDALVAGALLLYPEYYDWDSKLFCDAETVIDKLSAQKRSIEKAGRLRSLDPGYIERQVRKMILIIKGLGYAH